MQSTFPSRRLAWSTLAGLALVIGWDAAGLDLAAARAWAGPAGFPLQHHWFLSGVLHDGLRPLAWLLALWLTAGVWWPTLSLRRLDTHARIQWAASTWIGLLLITLVKRFSSTSCPWDLAEFGGIASHLSHWAWGVHDGGGGHCFPAGHASAGFAFMAGYFAWRRQSPRLARLWLGGAIVAGLLLGVGQQLRGAHFMSHTLWTAWLCWASAWAIDALRRRFLSRRTAAPGTPALQAAPAQAS
jgi:membrane-associated PAP2 superfamily phosphatase